MNTTKKRVIILFGPPGAGKGTQAQLIAEKLGLYHFETSKVLERIFNSGDLERTIEADGAFYKMSDEKGKWERGELNSPPFVTQLVLSEVRELREREENIIFSGSPRTVYEAVKELPIIKELFGVENIKAFYIEISPEQTIYRNSNRRICELIRHPILFTEETKPLTVCPLDGSKLITRDLDTPETIKVRLEKYKNETSPVLAEFEKHGIHVEKINGEQSVVGVYNDILKNANN